MSKLFARFGPVVALTAGGGSRVFSTDPNCPGTIFGFGEDFVRTIEADGETFHRTPLSGRLYPHVARTDRERALREWATGLFAVNDDDHRRHRQLMAPGFVPHRIEAYVDPINRVLDRTVAAWELGRIIDLHAAMMGIALRVATRVFFGEEIGREGSLARAGERSLKMVLSPLVLMAPFDLRGLPYARFLDQVMDFNREMHRLVDARTAEGATGTDVLSALISSSDADGVGLTNSEVVGHASVLFAAGHETTSNAMTWTLFLLSHHPSVARSVSDEISAVLRGAEPSIEHLPRLRRLENVVLESLRLMPPAPWNTRTVSREIQIGGFAIEKGTEVIASIFHTHRSPELWPESDAFLPDRWTRAKPSSFAFNPFGGGPRICLGASFAMMEMKLVLAGLLQRFSFEPVLGARVDPVVNITMSLRGGLPMVVRSRDMPWHGPLPPKGTVHRYLRLPK